ncbi:unnamed protein product [Bemisia tabaci]|uniref:Uncharacterized protein n=1 Tax=Bemisia tabaci TaxID=7038 RepID=A0A9P0A707_BEMTA|nr:unnamed protein product [Bemisia tabaci]
MASLKLIVCCVALVLAAVVDAHPKCKKSCKPKPRPCHNKCPDRWVGGFFLELDCTLSCDMDWIDYQIDLIGCKRDCSEYQVIIDLYGQIGQARDCFDKFYDNVYEETCGLITDYRGKYNLMTIQYTERIVSCRKNLRQRIFKELCQLRKYYFQLLRLLDEFCGKYNINRKARCLVVPRGVEYSFGVTWPSTVRCKELINIYDNCFNDYKYLTDIIAKLNFPDNSPLCGRRQQLLDNLIAIWIEFDNRRRCLDIDYFPRLADCWDREDQIDLIAIELMAKLRPFQVNFAIGFYDIYDQLQDLCNEGKFELIEIVDWNNYKPQLSRGCLLPSPYLRKYFDNILVTCNMDYNTAIRLWNDLDCKPGCDLWKRKERCIKNLKKKLCKLIRRINKLIRDIIRKINSDYLNCLDDFDNVQRAYIDEVILNCNNDLWPLLIDFRADYYDNDDVIYSALTEKGIAEFFTRNIIPSSVVGYDTSLYCIDERLRNCVSQFDLCVKKNFYVPVADLIQIKFDNGCKEYKLRCKCLKDLECIWLEYRKLVNKLLRRITDLICKRKIKIGCDEYNREIQCIIDWLNPCFDDLINRFRSVCFDINGILDNLYSRNKNQGCSRRYKFIEADFKLQISASASVKVC